MKWTKDKNGIHWTEISSSFMLRARIQETPLKNSFEAEIIVKDEYDKHFLVIDKSGVYRKIEPCKKWVEQQLLCLISIVAASLQSN